MPLIFYALDGYTESFNTDNVVGGVIAQVRSYGQNQTDVLYFPAFAGRTATLINLLQWTASSDPGWSVDYNLGYPRVIVNATSLPKRLAVVMT